MLGERPVQIPCGEITLRGVFHSPVAAPPAPGFVVCHPHPLYGGTMENNVVRGVSDALASDDFAVLRFDFRGAGRSGGTHGGGEAECEDVRAAIEFLAADPRVDSGSLGVVGYSFGAWVGLRVGCEDDRVKVLLAVAPPLADFPMDYLMACPKPKLFVAGTRDPYCPLDGMDGLFRTLSDPKSNVLLDGADHFLFGRETHVGRAAAAFAGEWLRPPVATPPDSRRRSP